MVEGINIPKFPLEDLTWIEDLIYLDGPLLSHFKSKSGNDYLYYWCDVDENYNRWLVFEVKNLNHYLAGRVSLHELITSADILFVVDIDDDLQYQNIRLVESESLPENYLPEIDSYPENGQENYKLLIDKSWTLQDLSKIPDAYNKVYAIIHSLEVELIDEDQEQLEFAYRAYPWRGGWSTANFYGKLTKLIPPKNRPTIASIQYASAGWIELELFTPISFNIESVIINFVNSQKELDAVYKDIYKGLRARKLTQISAKPSEFVLGNDNIQFAESSIERLSSLLGFTDYVPRLNDLTANPLAGLKILLAFYRQLEKLAEYQISGKVNFDHLNGTDNRRSTQIDGASFA